MDEALLGIDTLVTGYGKKQVLSEISMHVRRGEIVGIIGPNGAGKSTLLRAIAGLVPAWRGVICFQGKPMRGCELLQSATGSIAFAPQGNRVFGELTVAENLALGGFHLSANETRDRIVEVLQLFPVLALKFRLQARKLSGGEQQMVAIARALVPKPRLLLLDEPSMGLAPSVVSSVFERVCRVSRETNTAVLIVEQKVREVLKISHRVYSMKLGKISFDGTPQELERDSTILRDLYL